MVHAIDKYIVALRRQIERNSVDITWDREKLAGKKAISRLIRNAAEGPLNRQRASVVSRLAANVRAAHPSYATSLITRNLSRQFEKFWPDYTTGAVYENLLTSVGASGGGKQIGLSAEGLSLLARSYHAVNGLISHEDVPAICYLNFLLNGTTAGRGKSNPLLFDHVVVDECQDLSPIELSLLRRHSSNGSFTLLSDMNQALLPHKSVLSWKELKAVWVETP